MEKDKLDIPEITKDDIRKLLKEDDEFQQVLGMKEPKNYKEENCDCKLINIYLPKLIKKIGNKGLDNLNSDELETAFSLSVILDITKEINLHKEYPKLFSDKLTFDFLLKIMDDYKLAITNYDDDYRMTYDFLDYVSNSLFE